MNPRLLARCALLFLAVGGFCHSASGQPDPRRRFLPKSLFDSFKEVVRKPVKCTVQVYSDGYRAALGAIVREDGHIVTKASELKGKIEVQLAEESEKRSATIVAKDPTTDLAVLKIEAEDLPVVPWAMGDPPRVGSWLATTGWSNDVPISIGVVSVAARKISPPQAALGIQLDEGAPRIMAVIPGMAAAKAGLREGDIIRKIDDTSITGREHLQDTIRAHMPGDKATIVYERDGQSQTMEITLGSMSDFGRDERSEFQNSLGGALSERRTGFPLAIQHDSVLRPADCGGPVVDVDGNVVGLNIARAGRVESYALPASLVRETVDKLLKMELTSASTVKADDTTPRRSSRER